MRTFDFDRLDEEIRSTEERLSKLRAARAALDDPEIAELIQEPLIFQARDAAMARTPLQIPGAMAGLTNMEKLRKFFSSRNNQPALVKEIVAGTGITENGLRSILYVGHKKSFAKTPTDSGVKFCLSQPVEQEAG